MFMFYLFLPENECYLKKRSILGSAMSLQCQICTPFQLGPEVNMLEYISTVVDVEKIDVMEKQCSGNELVL